MLHLQSMSNEKRRNIMMMMCEPITPLKIFHCIIFDICMLFELFGGSKMDSLEFDCTPRPLLKLLTWIVKKRIKYDKNYDGKMGIMDD